MNHEWMAHCTCSRCAVLLKMAEAMIRAVDSDPDALMRLVQSALNASHEANERQRRIHETLLAVRCGLESARAE